MFGCLVVLCCGVLLASGCAKKDMVKPEEPVAATQPAVESAKPAVTDEAAAREAAARDAAAKEAAAREAAALGTVAKESAVKEEAAKEATKAAELEQALATIYFAFDSPALSPEARDTLTKNAGVLNNKPDLKAKIEGHCDERGSDEYNLALGEKRAKSAQDYLVTLGIRKDRLSIISFGKEKPLDPGHDETAWPKNRRAEFIIVK